MQFGILGPLEVVHAGEQIRLGGHRQRAVLARLLLDARRVVPAETLVEDVWAGRPPPSAHKTLQKYVSELRKALPRPVLVTSGRGYLLDVDPEAIDARRFERLVEDGEAGAALSLWRGEVLADLDDVDFVHPERTRLGELRLAATETCFATQLAAGRHAESVGELSELTAAYPLRERLAELLMLALYRSGRQVEALRAFGQHRRRLMEEVGVEPADELRRLEAAILRHDPELDLPPDRPAPAGKAAGNLPLPLTSFIGRSHDIASTCHALHEHRLVTLTGPGGVGKTRLALEVAALVRADHPGGVWLVDLASVHAPELVVDAVASVLSIECRDGGDASAMLVDALAHRADSLLVLDNCEHQVEACASFVSATLRAGEAIRVLATSRRPIGVDGEFVRPVAPLPDDEAVELFAARARLAGADVDADGAGHDSIAEICRGIDGLPLAIELVASQLRVLAVDDVTARLGEQLHFRGRAASAPARQRTLMDTVLWSHELLPAATQQVFARLGVFCASLSLDAAEAVCGASAVPRVLEHVTTLVDHSLLVSEHGRGVATRYRLLETLRLFALDRLYESGDETATRCAHAAYFLDVARESRDRLYGPDEVTWRRRLEIEEPNLHAALAWSAEHDPAQALQLAVALWPFWDVRWSERHGAAQLEALLTRPDLDVDDSLRAWGLTALAELAANPGEARRSVRWAVEAVAAFRRLGDQAGLARALFALGLALGNGGRLTEAEAALAEGVALARGVGDRELIARSLNATSYVATRRGQFALAVELNREEVSQWTGVGSRRGEATALRHLAVAEQYVGDLDEAERLCQRALEIWIDLDDPASIAHVRLTLADVARLRGDGAAASVLYDEALAEFRAIGDRRCTASTFKNLAMLAATCGEHARSSELFRRGIALRHDLGDEAGLAECLEGLACSVAAQEEVPGGDVPARMERAVTMLAAATSIRETTGASATPATCASFEPVLGAGRAALGDAAYAAAVEQGRRLRVPEVVAFALEP